MKLFKINTFLLCLCLAFNSCTDIDPQDQLAETNVWKTPEQYNLFANQFYGWLRDFNAITDGPHSDSRSDLVTSSTLNVFSNGTNTIPSSDANYTTAYNRLRQVNLLLKNAVSYTNPNDIKKSVGEAKFFRAYLHFELLQLYGDAVIADKTFETTSPELNAKRNPRAEVIDFIMRDLYDASGNLPGAQELSGRDAGRVSREAAQAFLSRVALYEGTWQKFRANDARGKELLAVAAVAAKKVIDSRAYILFKNTALDTTAYKYLFILENIKSNPEGLSKSSNTEYILSKRHDEAIAPIGLNITQGYLANSLYITRKMANMYLARTGLPINPETWNYSKMASEFNNRDYRMTNTMMVAGRPYWSNAKGRTTWQLDDTDLKLSMYPSFTPTFSSGYHNQKWCTERVVANTKEGYDFPVIRYGEVLLNYAEAVFERDGAISDEDLNISLNLVRSRVNSGMPKLTNALASGNGLDMRTEIRRERTVELFNEGFRLDDLKRWKTAEVELSMDLLGVKWTGTEFQAKWTDVSRNKNSQGCLIMETGRVWKERNYLYPLPTDQLQLNPNLKQNSGWE
ncbi:RagB/SusD family nutrient uptake outer membrane protein [Pedobacter sp. MC2016-24]|uniref:RagB/SusD family nutrient uptake outer membrane protein n=1 Tax=Pedobacter sp. MC2016-24 TaxID=2780090 RepID=UPI00187F870C|nr:RagB/SusD family nutrient uptake outer membrane protein [Pedobacter sp. MC2016-24]MBE9599826.1 RagB/SusD family nutrient uptake outer membrane protein [Pedobacter sp. MC2016-24]